MNLSNKDNITVVKFNSTDFDKLIRGLAIEQYYVSNNETNYVYVSLHQSVVTAIHEQIILRNRLKEKLDIAEKVIAKQQIEIERLKGI